MNAAKTEFGVEVERVQVDDGPTGTNRPGLRAALAACRAGDTLVVTKLDRWPARFLTPARSSRWIGP